MVAAAKASDRAAAAEQHAAAETEQLATAEAEREAMVAAAVAGWETKAKTICFAWLRVEILETSCT